MKFKKRLVYGSMVFTWVIATAYLLATIFVSTDIVNGTCIPYGAYSSYAADRVVTLSIFLLTYLFPVILMVFCYSRIVYSLNRKVTANLE